MKIRRFSKVVSIFVALTMLMSMSTGVMASGVSEASKDYVVTYQAEEITDTDALIQLALEQSSQKAKGRSAIPENENQLEATQLLETREYADGTVEKDFVSKGVMLLSADKNGIYSRIAPATSNRNYYGISLTCSLYYTEGSTMNSFRVTSVSTKIINLTNQVQPLYGSHYYQIFSISAIVSENFTCSTATQQIYNLYSSHGGYYPSSGFPAADGIYAESEVHLSNGQWFYVGAPLETNV